MNYIKGYRYELYCNAKSVKTANATLLVMTSETQTKAWNDSRRSRLWQFQHGDKPPTQPQPQPQQQQQSCQQSQTQLKTHVQSQHQTDTSSGNGEAKSTTTPATAETELEVKSHAKHNYRLYDCFKRQTQTELVMRFEFPDDRNRWDKPLFVVDPNQCVPFDDIVNSFKAVHKKGVKVNRSTQSVPLSATNYLHEMDRMTQDTIRAILKAQSQSGAGPAIVPIHGSNEPMHLKRTYTMPELRRLSRQFITYTKSHPPDDPSRLPTLWTHFLNQTF